MKNFKMKNRKLFKMVTTLSSGSLKLRHGAKQNFTSFVNQYTAISSVVSMAASLFSFLLSPRNLYQTIKGPLPLTSHHMNIKISEKSPLLAVTSIKKIEMLNAVEYFSYHLKVSIIQVCGIKYLKEDCS